MPRVIDPYRLLRPLGWGGTGIVCEAEDPARGRRVAIKLIPQPASSAASPWMPAEASFVGAVQHPHVVSLHGIGTYSGGVYLVMELVEGQSLQSFLSNGRLPWREATAILVATCAGVRAVHAHGIIHRDLKPANILLAPLQIADCRMQIDKGPSALTAQSAICNVQSAIPKVSDFGLAQWLNPAKQSMAGKRLAGTPHYMSPEQCRQEECDERTDIYSLGATYFTLLTGSTPFTGATPLHILFEQCSSPVPDPCRDHPEIPGACAEIVGRAMAKKRSDRYDSVHEMRDALRAVLHGRS
jgi:urea transport system substrate-binding protein